MACGGMSYGDLFDHLLMRHKAPVTHGNTVKELVEIHHKLHRRDKESAQRR